MVMGNASGRDAGKSPSGDNNFEENYEEPMAHSPPHSPTAPNPSLFFISRNPRVPLRTQAHELLHNTVCNGVIHNEKLIRAKISWNHGGRQVAVTGSWDNWETRELLQNIGNDFIAVKLLPSGLYQYRFIVDGYLRCAPDFPWAYDVSGTAYNVLDLQESVLELPQHLENFEPPPSPPSSYDNRHLIEDDFSKPPPEVPPQLQEAFLNNSSSSSNDGEQPFVTPHPSQLNHLHIQNHFGGEFFALSSTHRFRRKFVTVELYKPLRRANQ